MVHPFTLSPFHRVACTHHCHMRVERPLIVLLAGLVLPSAPALADVVVPSPDVTSRVIVRASASSERARIGSLRLREQLEIIGAAPNWREVRLPSGAGGLKAGDGDRTDHPPVPAWAVG
jgi:hypothetical protein